MNPEPDEVAALDRQINLLRERALAAHRAWYDADAELRAAIVRREETVSRLAARAGVAAEQSRAAAEQLDAARARAAAAVLPGTPADEDGGEASTRTVQNLLFVLGGLLLGLAAIVFTAVAWAQFGVQGRAEVLGVVTLLALSLPVIALARGLRATAETFAAVALLLVGLDGYAAWYVDLGGVQGLPGTRYTGLVFAVTAAVALAYRLLARLIGPAFVALVLAQPVVPLLLARSDLSLPAWAAVTALIGAADLAVVWRLRANPADRTVPGRALTAGAAMGLQIAGWVLFGNAVAIALSLAAIAELEARTVPTAVWAGLALLLTALIFGAGAWVSGVATLRQVAAGAVVLAVAAGASRAGVLVWPGHAALVTAAVAAVLAVAVTGLRSAAPRVVRAGLFAGSVTTTVLVAFGVVVTAVVAAVDVIRASLPAWSATSHDATAAVLRWELPAAVALVTVAFVLSLPRRLGRAAALTGGALLLVSLPGAVPLVWWAPAALGLVGVVAALVVALTGRTRVTTATAAVDAAGLLVFAVLTGLYGPGLTAVVLGVLVVVGVATGVIVAARTLAGPDRLAVGGLAFAAGLVALPPMVGSALAAADVSPWWRARLTVAALALVVLAIAAVRRPGRSTVDGESVHTGAWNTLAWYAFAAALIGAVTWPAVGAAVGHEPLGVYGAATLLVIGLALVALPARATAWPTGPALWIGAVAAIPGAAALAIGVVPAVLGLIGSPYGWLAAIWTGRPTGVGLAPADQSVPDVTWAAAAALGVLALSAMAATYATTRRPTAALGGLGIGGPTAVLAGVAAAGAVWPSLPTASLLIGLILTVVAAVAPVRPVRAALATAQGVFYVGAGIGGALSTRWSTLAAVGCVLVAATVIGAGGRTLEWRLVGWLGAVVATLTGAAAAGFAADLPARDAAFGVLGGAILALAVGALLRGPRPVEGRAVEAAAHAGAVVALLFALGWSGYAAGISVIWGVVVGLRALWPGTSRAGRAALAAGAAGYELLAWWLLLASRDVTLIEAYTLPLAGVALLAGWAALRRRPDLTSWVAYGPALAAAFLPSLAAVIGTAGDPWRRIALGAGAIAVVVAGSMARLKAPVILGGIVVIAVALHELVLLWQLLPGWIYLAVGGVILVGLAITYERRLRDLGRLRTVLARMH